MLYNGVTFILDIVVICECPPRHRVRLLGERSNSWIKCIVFFFNFLDIFSLSLQTYGQKRAAAYFAAKEAYVKAKGLDLKRTHTLDDRKWDRWNEIFETHNIH